MHNKFAIVDDKFVLTGSLNWVHRSATLCEENVIIVDQKYFIDKYNLEFERLWRTFQAFHVSDKPVTAI